MANRGYALLLDPNTPQAFLALVDGYIHQLPPGNFLFCSSIEHTGMFVEAKLLKDRSKREWPVQIPNNYIVAIADMSDSKSGPGFLSQRASS